MWRQRRCISCVAAMCTELRFGFFVRSDLQVHDNQRGPAYDKVIAPDCTEQDQRPPSRQSGCAPRVLIVDSAFVFFAEASLLTTCIYLISATLCIISDLNLVTISTLSRFPTRPTVGGRGCSTELHLRPFLLEITSNAYSEYRQDHLTSSHCRIYRDRYVSGTSSFLVE